MDGVCFERDNNIHIMWSDKTQTTCSVKQFFEVKLEELLTMGDNTLFFMGLKTWGFPIVYKMRKTGYGDLTMNALFKNSNPKPKAGEFIYTVGARSNTWFSIKIASKKDTGVLTILSYENFVPIDEEMIESDFCEGKSFIEGMMLSVNIMRELGCTGSTVSSSATSIWKNSFSKYDVNSLFPNPTDAEYDFIRKSYHGGWCYVNKYGKVGKGMVLDVNSLYPYVMANCKLPVGKGKHFKGAPKRLWIEDDNFGFYVRIRCRFVIKDNHVPFIRISNDDKYNPEEILLTSDIWNSGDNCFERYEVDEWGELHEIKAELTLWKEEFELFLEHYNVESLEYIDGYKYNLWGGVFKKYVNKFRDMKENAHNKSERRIAKILMNSLSGNLAKNIKRESVYFLETDVDKIMNRCKDDASDKVIKAIQECGNIVSTKSRSHSYIAIGAAITSIAMCITVKAAQANYKHFLYSDTDSLHLDCDIDKVVGLNIDDKELGAWKVEHRFKRASYIQQKVYFIDDKKEGAILKWAGMKNESRRKVEEFINNPKTLKSNEFGIQYSRDIVTDFVNFTKRKVYGLYTIDISEFI